MEISDFISEYRGIRDDLDKIAQAKQIDKAEVTDLTSMLRHMKIYQKGSIQYTVALEELLAGVENAYASSLGLQMLKHFPKTAGALSDVAAFLQKPERPSYEIKKVLGAHKRILDGHFDALDTSFKDWFGKYGLESYRDQAEKLSKIKDDSEYLRSYKLFMSQIDQGIKVNIGQLLLEAEKLNIKEIVSDLYPTLALLIGDAIISNITINDFTVALGHILLKELSGRPRTKI